MVSAEIAVAMVVLIANPVDCEMRGVTHFLQADDILGYLLLLILKLYQRTNELCYVQHNTCFNLSTNYNWVRLRMATCGPKLVSA